MKMKTSLLTLLASAVAVLPFAAPAAESKANSSEKPKTYPETKGQPDEEIRATINLTEIGLMRTLLVLTNDAKDLEKLVAQRLSDVDFRVFPSAQIVQQRISSAEMRKLGTENKADLVLVADVTSRLKNKFGEFELHEGEATVQIFSPVSGEILTSQTQRTNGERNIDGIEAQRSAREKALDAATRQAIAQGLAKSHRLIVHTATVVGVKDNNQLLIIKNHMQKMEGIFAVRQISFDLATHVAELEIIGAPKSEELWRAHLERMPRAKIIITLKRTSTPPRSDLPSWFRSAN